MEPKAHYVSVGAFVITLLMGIIFFVAWIGRSDLRRDVETYAITFQGSVSGLQNGSKVLYRGVPIGHVADISIDTTNPELILVLADIKKNTPIKEDTIAELEMVGVTGLSQVQLTGGTTNSPKLAKKAGNPYPVIAAVPSKFERIFSATPQILYRINELLSQENLRHVSHILTNLDEVSSSLAVILSDEAMDLPALAQDARSVLQRFNTALAHLEDTLVTLDTEGGAAARSFTGLTQELQAIVGTNRDAIDHFLNYGLYELVKLLSQFRATLESITTITQGVERDPLSFFLGTPTKGLALNDKRLTR